jgi:antagonist of KipI
VTIRVISGGLQTTVQDLGRVGHQRGAIPVGGAMDRIALRIANMLVGNDQGAAAVEVSLLGPALVFEESCVIAIGGADLDATVDGAPIPVWHAARIPAGASLRFGRPLVGCRAYVAVAGGIDVPLVFGSRSTYLRAQFGGLAGRALRSGDTLTTAAPSPRTDRIAALLHGSPDAMAVSRWSISTSLRPRYSEEPTVSVIPGAHTDLLTSEARGRLTGTAFRVSSSSDRMGYRLEGPPLAPRERIELKSEGVAFGTIQLPPNGAPIILMADCQTTGGYPRIGEVASVDLPRIAQLKPGDRLRFRFVSLAEAQQRYLEQERDMTQARIGLDLRHVRGAS